MLTENDLIVEVSDELRAMATAGKDAAELLRHVQRAFGQEDCKLCERSVFPHSVWHGIACVSPVAGWCGFGGELSDDQVNSLVSPVIEEFPQVERGMILRGKNKTHKDMLKGSELFSACRGARYRRERATSLLIDNITDFHHGKC